MTDYSILFGCTDYFSNCYFFGKTINPWLYYLIMIGSMFILSFVLLIIFIYVNSISKSMEDK